METQIVGVLKENAFNCREIDPISNVYNFIQFKSDEAIKPVENAKTVDNEQEQTDIMPIGHEIKLEEVKEAPVSVVKEVQEDDNDTLLKKKIKGICLFISIINKT